MALRNQPYIPLYVQDVMTDEKLNECSAATQGIYFRTMFLMHKSEPYGKILLKQNHKQDIEQVENFCSALAQQLAIKHLPFSCEEVTAAFIELVKNDVCQIEENFLVQKRMIRDNALSEIRAKAGRGGGKKTQSKNKKFATDFAKAKNKANTENEIEYENENKNESFRKSENLFSDLSSLEVSNTIEYLERTTQKRFDSFKLNNLFEAFKVQYDKDFYINRNEVIKHFRNWLKQQHCQDEKLSDKNLKYRRQPAGAVSGSGYE